MNSRAIIPTDLAIRAMRDSGYRNTAYALAELIDNAAQAKATIVEVFCIERMVLIKERQRRRITEIAVLDNGLGMTPEVLGMALQFGNGTHLKDRSGIGRFGMGLPNASISQAKRVEVWTWQSGPDNAVYTWLDVDDVEQKKITVLPAPEVKPVPKEWRDRSEHFKTSGTLILWTKFDEGRLTWTTARPTLDNTEILVGRMYRKFIDRGDLSIRLHAFDGDKEMTNETIVRVNDPLYLMKYSSTPAPFNVEPMFEPYGQGEESFQISYRGKSHTVKVRMSFAKSSTWPEDGTDRGKEPYGKHARNNVGLSIVRADRELDLDRAWAVSYDPTERWWGAEIDFPGELDEVFGVTNNKQAATIFSGLANWEWTVEAEDGETWTAFKTRLADEGDPRAALLDIYSYIKDNLSLLRKLVETQGKGRRGGSGKRHGPNVEDQATTQFKKRADAGHEAPGDRDEVDDKAKEALVEDLKDKRYPEDVAREIAEAVKKRQRKVIFTHTESEMEAFFTIESKEGGITQVVFNETHPAYRQLVMALDSETEEATDGELIARISNASDTLRMLFAAWARLEVEDIMNREKMKRYRSDWGRMARDFLADDEDE